MYKTFAATLILALTGLQGTLAQEFLPVDEAFQYAAVDASGVIEIDWAIADGYYMYKKKLSFASRSDNVILGNYTLPSGEENEDDYFGKQEVFRTRFYVSIPYTIVGDKPGSFELEIKSQGRSPSPP